jgi:hypothetical protein
MIVELAARIVPRVNMAPLDQTFVQASSTFCIIRSGHRWRGIGARRIQVSSILCAARRKKNGGEVSGITPYFRSGLVLRSRAHIGCDDLPI